VTPVSATRKAWPVASRIAAWIAIWQRELSDRVHRDSDTLARSHGWTITATSGRFGFSSRCYRDPRFDQRAAHETGQPRGDPSQDGCHDHPPHLA
jgi:hypothetical protein